jgi:hypothetical protein
MEALSNSLMGLPSSNVSVRAGMRPLGLISRNQGSWESRSQRLYVREEYVSSHSQALPSAHSC